MRAKKEILTVLMMAIVLSGCGKSDEKQQESIIQTQERVETNATWGEKNLESTRDVEETEETKVIVTTSNRQEVQELPEGYGMQEFSSYHYQIAIPPKWGKIISGMECVYAKDESWNEAWLLIGAYNPIAMQIETELENLPNYFSDILLETIHKQFYLDDVNADPKFKVEKQEKMEINGRNMLCAEGSFEMLASGETIPCVYKAYYLLYTNEEEDYYDDNLNDIVSVKDIPIYFMMIERGSKLSDELSEQIDVMADSFSSIK